MNAKLNRAVVAAAALAMGAPAAYAAPVTTTGTANAEIVEQLTLTEDRELNFGRIAPDTGVASTVVLTPAATTVISASAGAPGLLGGEASGQFTVEGQTGKSVVVTLPGAAINVCDDGGVCGGGSAQMPVSAFTQSGTGTYALAGGGATSTETFYVGASIAVATTQAVGVYEGSFDVDVNYQ